MDYFFELEQQRSRDRMDRLSKAIGNNADEFKKLLALFQTAEPFMQKRVAWAIEYVTRAKPALAKPHIKLFIDYIQRFESDSLKRSFLVALGKQKIPANLQAKTLDICFGLMLDPDRAVAVKVFAMEIAKNIVLEHPDLKGELKAIIDDQWDRNTVAFRARGRMVLKALK